MYICVRERRERERERERERAVLILHKMFSIHECEGVPQGGGREGGGEGILYIKGKKIAAHSRSKSGSTQFYMYALPMNIITELRNNRLYYNNNLPNLDCHHASSITLSSVKLSVFPYSIRLVFCGPSKYCMGN